MKKIFWILYFPKYSDGMVQAAANLLRGTETDPIISKVSFSGFYVPDLARFDSVYEAHLEFANQRPRF